jgi:hypothetical protein
MIPSSCHPDRTHYANGLCRICYQKSRYHTSEADKTARQKGNLARYYVRRDKALKREANRQARMVRRQERRARVRARFEQVKINVRGAIGSKAREAQEKKRAREIEDARPLTKFWWKEGIAKPRHWIIEADQDPGKVMRGVEAAYTSAST